MLGGEARIQVAQALLLVLELLLKGAAQAHIQVVQALGLLAQALARVTQAAAEAFQTQALAAQAILHA